MTIAATECLLRLYDEHHELEDYQSGVPRWCSGCGDNAILAAVQRLCRDEGLRPEKTVFVSGIGCAATRTCGRRRPCSCPASGARAASRTT